MTGNSRGIISSHLKNDISCVLYRARTWRRPGSHVLCVPRRGFPRFATPESLAGVAVLSPAKTRPRAADPFDRPKAKIIDSSHVSFPGCVRACVCVSALGATRSALISTHPRSREKPSEDRRDHENSTQAAVNIFATDNGRVEGRFS